MNNTVKILFTAVLLLFLHQLAIYGQMDNHNGYRPKMLVYANLKNKDVLKHFNQRFEELDQLLSDAKVIKSPYAAARDMSNYNTILDSLYNVRKNDDVKSLLQNNGLEVTGQMYGRLDNSFHISDDDDVSSYKAKAQAEIGWDIINSKFYQKKSKTKQILYVNDVDRLQQYKKQNEYIFDDCQNKIIELYSYYLAVTMSHRLKNLDILNEASQLMLEQDRVSTDKMMDAMNEKIDLEYQLSQSYNADNLDKQPLFVLKPTLMVVDTLALMNLVNDNIGSKIITANQKMLENKKQLTTYLSTTRLSPFFRVSSYWTSQDRLSKNLDLGVRFTIPLWNQTKNKKHSIDTQSALMELQRITDNDQLRNMCLQQLNTIDKMNQAVRVEAMHIKQLKNYVEMRKKVYLQNQNRYNYFVRMEEYNQLLKSTERLFHLMLYRQLALINIEKTIGTDITHFDKGGGTMNGFNYDTDPQQEDAREMLRYQKTKLAKQQLIFTCFFLFLLILFGIYVVNRIMYEQYDGYIKIDQNHVRALDDIYVLRLQKKVGEHVNPGDTLYSYVLLNNIIGQYDVNHRPAVIKEAADMKLQAQLARQQIPVLRTKLSELQKQIRSESNDIFYGLTNNTAQNNLKAQIEETKTEIRKQISTVAIYEQSIGNTRQYIHGSGYDLDRAGMPYSPEGKRYNGSLILYACAPDSGIITDIKVPANTVLFKTEEVMSMQYSNFSIANLGVMVYVPSDNVDYISKASEVEVIVNKDITLKAHVKLLGLRVEDIPKHLLSNFSHDIDAVIAYLNFDKGQVVPFWVLNDNLPVRIRVNKLKSNGRPFSDRQFIFTNDGGSVPYKPAKP